MIQFFCLLLFLTFKVFAHESVILSHTYEDLFQAGVSGDDWFSKMAYDGHKLRLIKTGDDALETRMKLIQSASRSILLSTFIYDVDETAQMISANLCLKAKWGVDVRIMVDSLGSKKFYKKYAKKLRACGVQIQMFAPGVWDLLDVAKTLHEKLLIIDGHVLYMGGRGIQNSYHNTKPSQKFFHDLDIVIEGPMACWWQFKFIEVYEKARKKNEPNGKKDYPACYPTKVGNSRLIPIYGNPIFDKSKTPIEDVYIKALENLEQNATVKLYAPYFVPTKRFGAALVKAQKKKNANIMILTNSIESNDEGLAMIAAMSYETEYIMQAGIDIRLYPGPMTLHRKVGIFDGKYGHVGSDNFDSRGQFHQSESVVVTDDKEIVSELESEFDHDFEKSKKLTTAEIIRIRKKPGFFQKILSKQFREYF